MRQRKRRLADVSRETLLTAALVTVCFAAFFGLVRLSFPEGMSLRGLIGRDEQSPWSGAGAERELDMEGREAQFARLTRVVRKVMDKPASAIAWEVASSGDTLGDRHSVQTHAQSSATIEFDDRTSVVLGENSMIVLKSFDGDPYGTTRRARLVVFGGELLGRIGGAGRPGKMQVQVETPTGVVQLRSGEDDEDDTTFRVEVDRDSTAKISVFQGKADVVVGKETVRVEADQAVEVTPHREAPVVKPLPEAPRPIVPAPDAAFPYRSQTPEIRFEWSAGGEADRYRFVLARDSLLTDVVLEHVVDDPWLALSGMEEGDYYWAVAGIRDALEGAAGTPRRFRTERDAAPPHLDVTWPEGAVRRKTMRLTGRTEPGARVFVGAEPARMEETGRFEIDVALVPGANRVVVESVDEVGNSTYASRIVKALY